MTVSLKKVIHAHQLNPKLIEFKKLMNSCFWSIRINRQDSEEVMLNVDICY